MLVRLSARLAIAFAFCWILSSIATAQIPVGTAFSYQGRLTDGGAAANGSYDIQIKFFDHPTAGNQIGSTQTISSVAVSGGLFTLSLDFGFIFTGNKGFLELGVRPGGTSGAFTTLSGRQELKPAPNAINSSYLGGQVPSYYTTLSNQTGVLSVASGGTGATTVDAARQALGAMPIAPPNPLYTTSTLDAPGFIGQDTSITIGADGLGLISYRDGTTGAVKVAHCSNSACTSATISVVDQVGTGVFVNQQTSIAIGADGLGLIAYHDNTTDDLKVAHCTNVACTSVGIATVDSAGNMGLEASLTIGADGLGLISYLDYTNKYLKVAHCSNTACTSSTVSNIDTSGQAGYYTSITIGVDGFGLISYYKLTGGDLKVAHCTNVNCTSATLTTIDTGSVGEYTSITVGTDGLGLVSYRANTGGLKVAHCANVACTSITNATVIEAGSNTGIYTSITIGADGFGLVSYYSLSGLRIAHCTNLACTTSTTATLQSSGGQYMSITVGTDGFGLVSYYDTSNGDLKVAHCSNVACQPNVRRR